MKFLDLKFKWMFFVFFVFLLIFGLFYTLVYVFLINSNINHIVATEMDRAESLVNVIYFSESSKTLTEFNILASLTSLKDAIREDNVESVAEILSTGCSCDESDMLIIVSEDYKIIVSSQNNTGEKFFMTKLIDEVVLSQQPLVTTEKISMDWLLNYDEGLYWDSVVKKIDTDDYNEYALISFVLVPVFVDGSVQAIFISGKILNRDDKIINALKSHGVESAIYVGDINIASSFFTENNNMYVGFDMPEDIYGKIKEGKNVLKEQKFFIEKSYVKFLPVRDHNGEVIGAVAFGVAKSKYNYMSSFLGVHKIIPLAIVLLLIGVIVSYGFAYYITKKFMKPLLKTFAQILEGISRTEENPSKKMRK